MSTRLRSFTDLVRHWNAHRTATPWRTTRTGNLARRLRGGVSVSVVYDKRTSRHVVRFDGGRGGLLPETFATIAMATQAVDALEASR